MPLICKFSKYWKKRMKNMNYLASFNYCLLEICFLKEALCGTRHRVCVTSRIVAPLQFCLRKENPLKNSMLRHGLFLE